MWHIFRREMNTLSTSINRPKQLCCEFPTQPGYIFGVRLFCFFLLFFLVTLAASLVCILVIVSSHHVHVRVTETNIINGTTIEKTRYFSRHRPGITAAKLSGKYVRVASMLLRKINCGL
ncbi:hypothetical protein AMECASPLE_001245 [Ameca splendens]|uniref:Uncharacterized protein n=1 Tax=Ameca splendens TaxID=208324 RepID=A0ABV0ZJK7_9TELE